MPTRQLNRVWCSTCKDWELHTQHYPNWEDWFCPVCENKWEPSLLSEIPEDKIKEQRERYKEHNRHSLDRIMGGMMLGGLMDMWSEPGSDVDIRESDAGQRAIDEEARKERERKSEERRRVRDAEIVEKKRFQNVGRNDQCLCGSGLKYKKCCETKIRSYR